VAMPVPAAASSQNVSVGEFYTMHTFESRLAELEYRLGEAERQIRENQVRINQLLQMLNMFHGLYHA
jgi:TolA-binding protein